MSLTMTKDDSDEIKNNPINESNFKLGVEAGGKLINNLFNLTKESNCDLNIAYI